MDLPYNSPEWWCVYVLSRGGDPLPDETFAGDRFSYVGITNHLVRRMTEHAHNKVPATRGRNMLYLCSLGGFTRTEAAYVERYLKSGRSAVRRAAFKCACDGGPSEAVAYIDRMKSQCHFYHAYRERGVTVPEDMEI